MGYIDCCLIPVPTANKEKYMAHAKKMSALFIEFGALECVECWGDEIPEGKVTSLPMAVKAEKDETVLVSWMIWPDKDTRNAAHGKMRSDSRMESPANLFDPSRMAFGGFELASKVTA